SSVTRSRSRWHRVSPDRRLSAVFLLAVVAGCATRPKAPVSAPASVPAPVPGERSRYGNGPIYQVDGHRYLVLNSSDGYRERGIASWYGKKFHGKPTSSRETYDMNAMTAAHRTLPLPSWVRVTNLRNDRSVVVRINDRGPFVPDRLIDLSYAAAQALDIVEAGTAPVEVVALDYREAPPDVVVAASPARTPADSSADPKLYVQVGAFGDVENARRRFELLQTGGIEPAFVHQDAALYRVRIGPIADAAQYDAIVLKLKDLGISEMHLVTE
ncbi:MAG TPA: septal ring lytic transglycosylase RlpA family protein, partial [Woeseiaceae bacterium]|nr:septal ring lytic transglycosylase RlpA family protein [Woeseiaceae bacterium]